MSTGRFIVFEGIDGSGKTEQSRRLAARIGATYTREPTDYPVGTFIRSALRGDVHVVPEAMGFLFAADRIDHAEKLLGPARGAGTTVVCDRYTLSNVVYRAAETDGPLYRCGNTVGALAPCDWTGEPTETLRVGVGAWATPTICPKCGFGKVRFTSSVVGRATWAWGLSIAAPRPDLTIILVVPTEVAVERRRARGGAPEMYENRRMLSRCAALYARAGDLSPAERDRIVLVDGTGTPDEVAERVNDAVLRIR